MQARNKGLCWLKLVLVSGNIKMKYGNLAGEFPHQVIFKHDLHLAETMSCSCCFNLHYFVSVAEEKPAGRYVFISLSNGAVHHAPQVCYFSFIFFEVFTERKGNLEVWMYDERYKVGLPHLPNQHGPSARKILCLLHNASLDHYSHWLSFKKLLRSTWGLDARIQVYS